MDIAIEQTNYIKRRFLRGVVFHNSLFLISILRSTMDDIYQNSIHRWGY